MKSFIKKRTKILVTGGAGYIGSHTCKLLKINGFEPIVFDNFSSGKKKFIKWGKYFKGDTKKIKDLDKAIKKFKPKAVIHFAANISVAESKLYPKKYYENNLFGTINLLEAMKKNKIKFLIFSSTAALYGNSKKKIINEDEPLLPVNPYGFSKLYSEQAIEQYANLFGIKFSILRYFNAAGADFKSEVGEDHEPETHLIPNIINSLIKNKVLKIYGKNFNTLDGTGVRDYIHVDDLGYAHILALKKILSTQKSFKLNLGTGKGYSVKQIITKAEQIFKKKIKIKYMPRRAGDVSKLISSSIKAKKVLKWKAQNSDLNNILKTAYNWHRKIEKI